jgi:hypothetical protein
VAERGGNCMKLSTLKSADRAAWRLMKVFEAEAKYDAEAKRLKEDFTALWLIQHKTWKKAAVAAATRKDKGVVLWTVFKPGACSSMREIIRTPNLLITKTWWADTWDRTLRRMSGEPYVEIQGRWSTPEHDFKEAMRMEVAA